MDEDPVLRSLGEELARDDPRLAALLGDGDAAPSRWHTWRMLAVLLLAPPLTAAALLLPPTVVLGLTAMLLVLLSPLAVCWLCATADHTASRPH